MDLCMIAPIILKETEFTLLPMWLCLLGRLIFMHLNSNKTSFFGLAVVPYGADWSKDQQG